MAADQQERKIFKYHNGERDICADPMVLHRKIRLAWKKYGMDQLSEDAKQAEDLDKQAEAEEKIQAFICGVFGVRPLSDDGAGLTEDEQLALWKRFDDWIDETAEKNASLPRSSPSTESASSAESDSPTASDAA